MRICAALIERVRYAQRIAHPDPHRLRRVERLVPDAQPRGPGGRGGGALQPLRRAGRRHLPERLRPPLPHGAHRELRPARERHRPDLHESPGAVPADDLSPAAALRRAHAGGRPRRPRRRRDLRSAAGPGDASAGGRVHHVADLGPFTLLDAVATCDEAGRDGDAGRRQPRPRPRPGRPPLDLAGGEHRGRRCGRGRSTGPTSRRSTRSRRRAASTCTSGVVAASRRGARATLFPAHSITVLRFDVA